MRDINNKEAQSIEEAEILESKVRTVLLKKRQRRIRVFLLGSVFMIFFSMYFVGTYFMNYTTYSSVPDIIDDLNVIFFKDSCLENMMVYVKENIIQNKTYTLFGE